MILNICTCSTSYLVPSLLIFALEPDMLHHLFLGQRRYRILKDCLAALATIGADFLDNELVARD